MSSAPVHTIGWCEKDGESAGQDEYEGDEEVVVGEGKFQGKSKWK